MSYIPQASELQDIALALSNSDEEEREFAFQKMVQLNAQNVDCGPAYQNVLNYRNSEKGNPVRYVRFMGSFNERYLESQPNLSDTVTQFYLTQYESQDPLLKGIVVRQIGRIINDTNID